MEGLRERGSWGRWVLLMLLISSEGTREQNIANGGTRTAEREHTCSFLFFFFFLRGYICDALHLFYVFEEYPISICTFFFFVNNLP